MVLWLGDGRALLSWRNGDQEAVLEADVRAGSFSLGVTLDGGRCTFDDEDLMGAGGLSFGLGEERAEGVNFVDGAWRFCHLHLRHP